MGTTYYKVNSLEVKAGNRKQGTDTLIYNLGSATECPSKKLGLCQIPSGLCYAMKEERMYHDCKPHRDRQAQYWLNTDITTIIADFDLLLKKYKKLASRVKYLRYNESGDFYSQACITKFDALAKHLKDNYNIITYGYSARSDLNFKDVNFLVKGSSHNAGNTGECITRKIDKTIKVYHENNKKYYVCPGNCRNCKLCKIPKTVNVVIPLH